MAYKNFQVAKLNSEIWEISFSILFSNLYCLMKATILSREYVMFLVSPSRYSFILKKEIGQKQLSHNYGSANWLML